MANIDYYERAGEFRKNDPEIYNKARILTDSNTMLASIYDNMSLFRSYSRAECHRYVDLAEALFNLKPDSVLIYFTEIKLYGLFTPKNYNDFCRNLADKIDNDELTVNVYQLVLSEEKQKLVFICTDKEYYTKIQNYSSKCFGVTPTQTTQDGDQITVNTICSGDVEIISAYNKLYNYIRSQGDNQCCDTMKQVQLLQKFQHNYREYACNDSVIAKNMEELMSVLKNIPIGTHIENLNIAIAGGHIINGDHNNISPAEKKISARKWIENNPPNDKEITTDYFQRFISENENNKIVINHFSGIVTSAGFVKKNSGRSRYWTRK